MRHALRYAALAVAIAIVTGCGGLSPGAGGAHKMRLNFTLPVNSIRGDDAKELKRLVEKATDGEVKVQEYPAGQLYKSDPEAITAVKSGAIEAAMVTTGDLSQSLPAFQLFELPYFFPDQTALDKVEDGPVGAKILDTLESQNMVGLAYIDSGAAITLLADHAIHAPADIKGLRVRSSAGKIQLAAFKQLGASPITIPAPDVASAASRGVIDSIYTSVPTAPEYEVSRLKFATEDDRQFFPPVLVVNQDWWQKLPEDLRTKITSVMPTFVKFARTTSEKYAKNGRDALVKQGMSVNILTEQERQVFSSRFESFNRGYRDEIGASIYDEAAKVAMS